MKRYNNLYEKIYSYENLLLAHDRAKKGKSRYIEVKEIDKDPAPYLLSIQKSLIDHTYKTSPYVIEDRIEGKKLRTICKLPYYPDRIVHHAIMNIMEPIWVKSLIRDTYQSIKSRGVHLAVKRIRKIIDENKNETKYCLKIDVKKYYPSVDNEIMKAILRKKIKDNELLNLLDEIVDSIKGLPIGNYLSQIFGNLYLSGFDHWIKEEKQVKFYFRYCDDCVFFGDSKEELHQLRREVEEFLINKLKLEVKNNWQIFPLDSRGLDFLGYRFYSSFTLLRKSIKQSLKTKQNSAASLASFNGWLKYCDCFNLKTRYC